MRLRCTLAGALALALLPSALHAQSADRPTPGYIRVRIETAAGAIVVALDAKRAPKSTANFLPDADDGRFDGTYFYRAARGKYTPRTGFVEGGIGADARRALDPVPLEPTSRTGLSHGDGAISMARNAAPNSATGDFSLLVGASHALDAKPGKPGYAAFGRIVGGMDVVKRILAGATHPGGSGAMKGEMLASPVKILRVRRLDGQPRPTGLPRPWELLLRR